jgi:hypothetical protein
MTTSDKVITVIVIAALVGLWFVPAAIALAKIVCRAARKAAR